MSMCRKTILPVAAISLLALSAAQPALAAGERFAIRFGLVGFVATEDADVQGGMTNVGFDEAYGGEFDFEWYFADRWGLEASIATGVDVDTDVRDTAGIEFLTATGITITPVTVGINLHVIRNASIDWTIGAVGGWAHYGDFDYERRNGAGISLANGNVRTDNDATYGLQTAIDFGVTPTGKWAVNVGVKYLKADFDVTVVENGMRSRGTIEIDPIVLRVMGVVRF